MLRFLNPFWRLSPSLLTNGFGRPTGGYSPFSNDSVMIVCGPIFVSKTPETIGPNRVRIPDSFFKAFLIKHQDAYHTIAFICPNNPDSVTIAGTAQSVNTVESFTGYDFFGFLDDSVEETVEDEVEVGIWVR